MQQPLQSRRAAGCACSREEAHAAYEGARKTRDQVAQVHAAFDKDYFYTMRGGRVRRFHPPALPEAASMPAVEEIFSASKSRMPRQGKLAAVLNHHAWIGHHRDMLARDAASKTTPQHGDSAVAHREASRFIGVSQPYSNGWLNIEPDGSKATTVPTAEFVYAAQRRAGLYISAAVDTLRELHSDDPALTDDYFGDSLSNQSKRHRTHHAALRGWYDATISVATAPVILGDKDNEARTRQFNEDYVTDLAEIGAGDGGEDVCNELKCYSDLTKTRRAGRGNDQGSGTAQDVGHLYAFGNTEEHARWANLGCKPRGRRQDGPLDHKTGRGYVKGHKGHYDDALRVKKNVVCLLLHNTFGGFSPPAATKIRRLGRAARGGVDRTSYSTRHSKTRPYVVHHTQRISKTIVHCDATAALDKIKGAKAKLSNRRGSWRTVGS